jgi:hypothetical protein
MISIPISNTCPKAGNNVPQEDERIERFKKYSWVSKYTKIKA